MTLNAQCIHLFGLSPDKKAVHALIASILLILDDSIIEHWLKIDLYLTQFDYHSLHGTDCHALQYQQMALISFSCCSEAEKTYLVLNSASFVCDITLLGPWCPCWSVGERITFIFGRGSNLAFPMMWSCYYHLLDHILAGMVGCCCC